MSEKTDDEEKKKGGRMKIIVFFPDRENFLRRIKGINDVIFYPIEKVIIPI